jgi:hypothetical protein
MPYLTTILITLMLTVPALSTELFRYRGAAKDGGTLEYVFDAGEKDRCARCISSFCCRMGRWLCPRVEKRL